LISLKKKKLFAFAGISSIVEDKGKEIKTCSIITIPANSFMKKIHDRMPQIIEESQYDDWLNSENEDKDKLLKILKPISSSKL